MMMEETEVGYHKSATYIAHHEKKKQLQMRVLHPTDAVRKLRRAAVPVVC